MESDNKKLVSLRNVDITRWRAEIIAALVLSKGHIATAADRLKVHRVSLSRWLAADSELRIARRKITAQKKEAS